MANQSLKWPAPAIPLSILEDVYVFTDSPTPITKEDGGGGAWRCHVIVPWQGVSHYFLACLRRRNTKPQTHRKRGSNAPRRSAGLLGDLAALHADLRALKRDLVRGEWYLEPANCRPSACCERKCFSSDQSAARSRFNSLPLLPLLPCSLISTPSYSLRFYRVRPFQDTVARALVLESGRDLTWQYGQLRGW